MGSILSLLSGSGSGGYSVEPSSTSTESSRVLAFHSSEHWHQHLNKVKETRKLVVIDFTASWCGPCKAIAPVFNEMAGRFTNVDFVKIDVDELSDVAQEYTVEAMPTFVFLKEGNEVDRVVGSNKDELRKKIKKHSN